MMQRMDYRPVAIPYALALALLLGACQAATTPSPSGSAAPSPTSAATPAGSQTPGATAAPGSSRAPYVAPPSEIGQVIATEPLILRTRPGTGSDSTVLAARLFPHMRFQFLEGPVAASGYEWYRVRVGELEGWVADGLRSDGAFDPWLAKVENGDIAAAYATGGAPLPQVTLLEPNGDPLTQLTRLTDADSARAPASEAAHGIILALSCGTEVGDLTWSSDGLLLAFSFGACDRAAFTLDIRTGGQRRVVDGRSMAFSPDGRQMVVGENYPFLGCSDPGCEAGPWELHRLDLVSDTATVITHSEPFVIASWPDWSPDGRTVAFMADTIGSERPAQIATWIVDLATGAERRVAAGQQPRWSPDGTRLAVLRQASYQEPPVIWTIGADGSDIAEIGTGYPPSWSPSGDRIAYWRQTESFIAEAVVSTPDGTDQLVAPVSGRVLGWSPDGREILIAGEDTLWRWTVGEPAAPVVVEGVYVSSAAWQPRLTPITPGS
jgi:Tol biopolymer transport system component